MRVPAWIAVKIDGCSVGAPAHYLVFHHSDMRGRAAERDRATLQKEPCELAERCVLPRRLPWTVHTYLNNRIRP